MQTIELAACPVCVGDLRSLGIPEDFDVKALGARVTIDYAMCAACGFVCQSRVLPLDALMRYYADSPKLRAGVATQTDRDLHAAQAAFMRRAAPLQEQRVLDVGADMGKFLDHLADGYNARTFYEEENQTARAWLGGSRHVDAGVLAPDATFDWIVLSQVLEHIVDPVSMLVRLRERLTPGGTLFIEVPNHGLWDDLDVGFFFEHVNYFSPASLTAALDRAGFHLLALEVTTDAHYFEGRCRIIRACARPRSQDLIADAASVVRAHERRHKAARAAAVLDISRALVALGRVPAALYGAADLAQFVLRHVTGGGGEISAIFDGDSRKHGRPFGSLAVLPPERIVTVDPGAIVIVSSAEADIRATIEATGYRGRIVCWSDLVDG